jgi:hypothetical protein
MLMQVRIDVGIGSEMWMWVHRCGCRFREMLMHVWRDVDIGSEMWIGFRDVDAGSERC